MNTKITQNSKQANTHKAPSPHPPASPSPLPHPPPLLLLGSSSLLQLHSFRLLPLLLPPPLGLLPLPLRLQRRLLPPLLHPLPLLLQFLLSLRLFGVLQFFPAGVGFGLAQALLLVRLAPRPLFLGGLAVLLGLAPPLLVGPPALLLLGRELPLGLLRLLALLGLFVLFRVEFAMVVFVSVPSVC